MARLQHLHKRETVVLFVAWDGAQGGPPLTIAPMVHQGICSNRMQNGWVAISPKGTLLWQACIIAERGIFPSSLRDIEGGVIP
ncbi:hypothetical protein DL89DRAFT_265696 [Linderina pennispora]|uniref:Uncharacterized protein n=1 Tax=Linderina pennispora TaxID=61395 RepID=A0A1Y1WFW1_9FUNG|nr:uncharacterized protein DL89DRAFT_265696 [Linderina pennispora]ORX72024.1 hypothetical protein DL89DRAFT_265696 [Linderina pennispora]